MAGILRWAAGGAAKLIENGGQWPAVPAADAIMAEYRDDVNPIGQYLRECCIEEADAAVPLEALSKSYNKWNFGSRNLGVKQVGGLVRAHLGTARVKDIRVPRTGGDGTRVVKGVVGFTLHDHDAPQALFIDEAAGAGLEPSIAGRRSRSEIPEDDL